MKSIKQEIEHLNGLLEDAETDYQNKKTILNNKIKSVQNSCPHNKVTYNPDPSGNNDSCYTCDDCGLEKKRFK